MLASTGVSAVTGLLFWVVAARRVPPDVLGIAAGLVAANAFLSYLTSLALPYAMLRFGRTTVGVSNRLNASLVVSTAASLVAAVLFGLVASLAAPTLAPYLHRPADVGLFAAAGVGAAVSLLLDNLLAARRRAGTVLVRNGAAGLLKLLALVGLSVDAPGALYLAVTLPSLVTAAGVLVALPLLVPGYRPTTLYRPGALRADPAVCEVAAFAWRNYPGALLSGAPQFALPLLAVTMLGAYRNAFFHVAWSIAQMVYLVPSVIANISLSQGSAASARTLAARAAMFSVVLLAPACAVGVLAPGLILSLYGGSYVDAAAPSLRLLLLAALPWTLVIVTQARLRTEHRFGTLTALTAGFCLLALGLPVGLAPAWGGTGMAAGWTLAVSVAAVLAWLCTVRRPDAANIGGSR